MFLTAAESAAMPGTVTATATSPKRLSCSVVTDEDGQFTISLPAPGRYVVVGRSSHYFGGSRDCLGTTTGGTPGASVPVSIAKGNDAHVDVLCDGF